MRMFLYYALHSTINQLKKIFKTWVMIFILICFVMGAGIGLFAAYISDVTQENSETEITEELEAGKDENASLDRSEEEAEEPNFIETSIGYPGFIELIVGAWILVSLVLTILSADKNAGRIFLPADVSLLFPSPMRPQSVMLFRIATQFGRMIFLGVYLLLQMPNLVLNLGLSVWAALALIVAFCVNSFIGTLFQLLFYLLGSASVTFKKLMRPILYACLLLLAGSFLLFQSSQNLGYLEAADGFFNGKFSNWIPFWGWLKGFCRYAIDGNALGVLLCMIALVLGSGILIAVIWNLKADFYEDAMAKSEEVAEIMEKARAENSSGVILKRKKDRSDKIRRNEMKHGEGANVFFFKSMYNRFRFAHFGLFTKTMEVYLVVAVCVSLFCRANMEQTTSLLMLVAVMAGLVFFRSLGNPLEADTKMEYFILIPESTWAKLFYSLIGGTVSSALDLFLPIVLGSMIIGVNPLMGVCWILPILSLDYYSTTVGVFIGLSVPTSAGKTLKQMVQVLFVYFGLLPDIIPIAVGAALGHTMVGVAIAVLLNVAVGSFFFALSPLFLDPVTKKTPKAGDEIFLS